MERLLITELTQGMEKAKQLHSHLCSTSPSQAHDLLLQRILSSYDKALSILKRNASSPVLSGGHQLEVSVDGSPQSDDLSKNLTSNRQECNPAKKRKLPTWTEQVRVNSGNGLDGPSDDGYSWRKYGQKDILAAKYPRSYYRCTYRLVQRCWATKQVQRSDEDPNVFDLTYKGEHTCSQSTNPIPHPRLPDQKQEFIQSTPKDHHQQQNQALLNTKANLRVSTDNLDTTTTTNNNNQMPLQFSFPSTYPENHDFQYSPSFLSPATSGTTNYFSPVNYNVQTFGGNSNYQCSELDMSEIISAHASTNNSPIAGMEFPSDMFSLDPNFPYNTSGFFT